MKKQVLFAALMLNVCSLWAQIPTSGLQFYYPFDGNTLDYSGKGNDAQAVSVFYDNDLFYQGDSGVVLTNPSAKVFHDFTNNQNAFFSQSFTFFARVFCDGFDPNNTYANIMEIGNATSNSDIYIRFIRTGNNNYDLQAGNFEVNGSFNQVVIGNIGDPSFNYYNITYVCQYDPNTQARTLTLSIEGNGLNIGQTEVVPMADTIAFDSSYPYINLGHRDNFSEFLLYGHMNHVAFYNRALSQNEIGEYWTACHYANTNELEGNQLVASASPFLTYQWVNCTTQELVVGANSATFTPTESGDYYVYTSFVDPGSGSTLCQEISPCVSITVQPTLGLESNQNLTAVYPNPAMEQCTVVATEATTYEVINLQGAVVWTGTFTQGSNTLNIQSLAPGMYVIRSANGGFASFIKQ